MHGPHLLLLHLRSMLTKSILRPAFQLLLSGPAGAQLLVRSFQLSLDKAQLNASRCRGSREAKNHNEYDWSRLHWKLSLRQPACLPFDPKPRFKAPLRARHMKPVGDGAASRSAALAHAAASCCSSSFCPVIRASQIMNLLAACSSRSLLTGPPQTRACGVQSSTAQYVDHILLPT